MYKLKKKNFFLIKLDDIKRTSGFLKKAETLRNIEPFEIRNVCSKANIFFNKKKTCFLNQVQKLANYGTTQFKINRSTLFFEKKNNIYFSNL